MFVLPKHLHKEYLEDAASYSDISFPNFRPEFLFWANFWKFRNFKIFKNHEGGFEWKLYLEDVDSYLDISFLNFQT